MLRKSSGINGFKFHLQVTDQGLPMGYAVTEASCHDIEPQQKPS
ncbi:Mobile element protein [Geobacillus proteiniphilus]|uniref:Mobile element protein n=1 Tax=Geobacillus proteiniphilus TaxID=860353 RepID=A0A1Q5T688_9BACL|nr:Mobile element protein [Geobacillus proteiniphilus]